MYQQQVPNGKNINISLKILSFDLNELFKITYSMIKFRNCSRVQSES